LLHVSLAVGAVKLGAAGHSMVALPPGEPIVGGVVSRTVIVWVTIPLVFPQASMALQLWAAMYWFAQVPAIVFSPRSCTVAPPHASLAVGAVKLGVAGHSIVASLPCPPMFGAVVSSTVMVWLEVLLLPQWSVAVQVRVTE
jgi:hypothetical protein